MKELMLNRQVPLIAPKDDQSAEDDWKESIVEPVMNEE
jgi:hypothetical protein